MTTREQESPVVVRLHGHVRFSIRLAVVFIYSLFVLGIAGVRGASGPVALALALAFFTLGFVHSWIFGRRRLVLGGDGVRILDGFRRRFIPYAELRDATFVASGDHAFASRRLVLHATSGPPIDLNLAGSVSMPTEEVAQRIVDGIAEARGAQRFAMLERGGRPLAQWTEDLAKATRIGGGYRAPSMTQKDLESVLADRAAPAEQRIGAALGLKAILGEEAKLAIRSARAESANPRMRIALERVEEDALDDDALEGIAEASNARVSGGSTR